MEYGLNNTAVKSQNYGLSLKLVLTGAASTRIDVANALNLTKMTASNIISSFMEKDIFVESPLLLETKKGRPSIGLSLSPNAPKAIGVYLGKDYGLVGLFDLLGKQLKLTRFGFINPSKDTVLGKVYDAIDEIIRTSINERIIGISLSLAGSVDHASGAIIHHENEELSGVEICSILSERYTLPCFAGDESENAASIEHFYGNAKDDEDFIYINVDNQIGSGIFLNGAPLRNAKGRTTNIGHLSIDYNGLSCSCGNRGCLQSYVSTEAMEKKLRDITKLKADFQGFCEMQAKKNDARVDWAFKDMMDKLGFAIISISNVLNPTLVLIGGKGCHIPDRYLSRLEKAISGKKMSNLEATRIAKPKFEDKQKDIATLAPILEQLFAGSLKIV